MSVNSIKNLMDQYFFDGDSLVAARLQAALALLEKMRSDNASSLGAHLAAKGSAGLKSHETFGNAAHERFDLAAINKNHGRRSSNLHEWGQDLIDLVIRNSRKRERLTVISELQRDLADRLRRIIEAEPLIARVRGRGAASIIADLLDQAGKKGKAGDVAQYLVAAKLMLRFGQKGAVAPVNKGDRESFFDPHARLGDFEIGNAVIEVALGLPDEKHIQQIEKAQDSHDSEVWLLTKDDRVETWKNEISQSEGIDPVRVTVSSVTLFVAQNVSEISGFGAKQRTVTLRELFDLYNKQCIEKVGPPGLRIEIR